MLFTKSATWARPGNGMNRASVDVANNWPLSPNRRNPTIIGEDDVLPIAIPVEPDDVTSTGTRKLLLPSIPSTPALVVRIPLPARRSNVATPCTVPEPATYSPQTTESGPELGSVNRAEFPTATSSWTPRSPRAPPD